MVKLLWKLNPFRLCQVNKLASQPVSFHKTGLSQKPNYVERAWDHSTKTVTTKTRHGSLKTSSWPPQKDEENSLWNANPHYYSIYVLLRLLHPHLGSCCQWNSNPYELNRNRQFSLKYTVYVEEMMTLNHTSLQFEAHIRRCCLKGSPHFLLPLWQHSMQMVATPKLRHYSNIKSLTLSKYTTLILHWMFGPHRQLYILTAFTKSCVFI